MKERATVKLLLHRHTDVYGPSSSLGRGIAPTFKEPLKPRCCCSADSASCWVFVWGFLLSSVVSLSRCTLRFLRNLGHTFGALLEPGSKLLSLLVRQNKPEPTVAGMTEVES